MLDVTRQGKTRVNGEFKTEKSYISPRVSRHMLRRDPALIRVEMSLPVFVLICEIYTS